MGLREAFLDIRNSGSKDDAVAGLFVICTFIPSVAALLPALLMVYRVLTDKGLRQRMWNVPYAKALAVFCLVVAVSTIRFGSGVSYLLCAAIAGAMVLMLYMRTVMNGRVFAFLLQTMLWGSMINAVVALVQSLLYDTAGGYRAPAMYYNPNYFGMMSGFVLVFALFALIRRRASRPLCAAAILSSLLGLFISNSRTGLATAVLGALVLILWLRSGRVALLVMGGAAIVGLALFAFTGFWRLEAIGISVGNRTVIWRLAIDGFLQQPILGQGAWAFARISHGLSPLGEIHAHNLFLEMLLTSGVTGTAMLTLYVVTNLRSLVRLKRSGQDLGLVQPVFVVVGMVLLHGMLDLTVFGPQNAIFVLLMLGIVNFANDPNAIPDDGTGAKIVPTAGG